MHTHFNRSWQLHPALLIGSAAVLFWASLLAFGGLLEGDAYAIHPVALLGARGIERAMAFNVLGFILPGLLLALAALAWRQSIPDVGDWPMRIAIRLGMLSALAFALQGLLPLDSRDLDALDSRLHAAAWTLWWVAFVPAALLLAHGMRLLPRWRVPVMVSVTMAVLVVWLAMSPPVWMAPGIAQRWMLGLWFGWWLLVARQATG